MLIKMQKMGLILEKNVPLAGNLKCEYLAFSFQTARKKYELLVQREEEVDKAVCFIKISKIIWFYNSANPFYAYGGYTPLLIQLLIHGDRLHWTDWIKHGQLETIGISII